MVWQIFGRPKWKDKGLKQQLQMALSMRTIPMLRLRNRYFINILLWTLVVMVMITQMQRHMRVTPGQVPVTMSDPEWGSVVVAGYVNGAGHHLVHLVDGLLTKTGNIHVISHESGNASHSLAILKEYQVFSPNGGLHIVDRDPCVIPGSLHQEQKPTHVMVLLNDEPIRGKLTCVMNIMDNLPTDFNGPVTIIHVHDTSNTVSRANREYLSLEQEMLKMVNTVRRISINILHLTQYKDKYCMLQKGKLINHVKNSQKYLTYKDKPVHSSSNAKDLIRNCSIKCIYITKIIENFYLLPRDEISVDVFDFRWPPSQGLENSQKRFDNTKCVEIKPVLENLVEDGWTAPVRAIGQFGLPTNVVQHSRDVVLTTYFTTRPNPMRSKVIIPNNIDYIKRWTYRLKEHRLRGVIFHDGLDPEFINKFKGSHISFHKVQLNDRSLNDVRYYLYWEYLKTANSIDRVLMTDVEDVEFYRNPFEFMDFLGPKLYLGLDRPVYGRLGSLWYFVTKLVHCFTGEPMFIDMEWVKNVQYTFNAGIIGGPRPVVVDFLGRLATTMDHVNKTINCNMAGVIYTAHKYFDDIFFTGYPFVSRFLSKEHQPKGVYLIHK